jgi:hypothetical protein
MVDSRPVAYPNSTVQKLRWFRPRRIVAFPLTSIAKNAIEAGIKKAMDWLGIYMCSVSILFFSRMSRRKRSYVLIILQLAYANAPHLSL